MRNPKAYIRLRGQGFDFSCYLGNGAAIVTGGGAEFEPLRRPGADAVTLFQGNALLTMDVPILFDAWRQKRDVEPKVEQVLGLCQGEGRKPPPNFIASGPIPFSGSRFQMTLPEWGDSLRDTDGTLVRQALTLKLVEFNDPTAIKWRTAPGNGLGKSRNGGTTAPPNSNSIVLKQRESLLEVAAAVFGDPGMAGEIGRINDIKDLRKKLPVGTRIKLPTGGPPFGVGPGQEA